MTVIVSCFGKAGWCGWFAQTSAARINEPYSTNGSIHISYAHSRHALEADPPVDSFYTRQLTHPVLVTVYHMLECYDMDILSYSGLNDQFGADYSDPSLGESEDQNWCLFSIEVRNTYGLPFDVTFERIDRGESWVASQGPAFAFVEFPLDNIVASTCRTVPPGSTCRCVINPIFLGNSRSGMVTKGNFFAAEAAVDGRTNVKTSTVVIRTSICRRQVQVVIRRHQIPKRIILVS